MKKILSIILLAAFVPVAFGATPTPAPSPTPVPRVAQDRDFRVPLAGVMLYGDNSGTPVKVKVNAQGYLLTMPIPTPTP